MLFGSDRAFILTELSILWLLVGRDCILVGHLTCSKSNRGSKGFLCWKLEAGEGC